METILLQILRVGIRDEQPKIPASRVRILVMLNRDLMDSMMLQEKKKNIHMLDLLQQSNELIARLQKASQLDTSTALSTLDFEIVGEDKERE